MLVRERGQRIVQHHSTNRLMFLDDIHGRNTREIRHAAKDHESLRLAPSATDCVLPSVSRLQLPIAESPRKRPLRLHPHSRRKAGVLIEP